MVLFFPARMGGENVGYGYKGKGSLMHLIVDNQGKPLYATLTAANGNKRAELPNFLDKLKVTGGMCIVEADKCYDSNTVRLEILGRGYYPLIPYRGNKKGADKWVVRMRWKVERCFSCLKRAYRRIATRWKRLSPVYEAFILLGISFFWVKKLVDSLILYLKSI